MYKHAVWALLSISVQAIPASSLHRRNLLVERWHVDERWISHVLMPNDILEKSQTVLYCYHLFMSNRIPLICFNFFYLTSILFFFMKKYMTSLTIFTRPIEHNTIMYFHSIYFNLIIIIFLIMVMIIML